MFDTSKILDFVPVCQLFGLSFHIPDYQRGYRWSASQVMDMLEDLLEFSRNRESQKVYSLQPLVVAKNGKALEVIDGQQRLTTLRLILGALRVIGAYELHYETREQSFEFIISLITCAPDCLAMQRQAELGGGQPCSQYEELRKKAEDNIDFYQMWMAYLLIETFLTPRSRACLVGGGQQVGNDSTGAVGIETEEELALFRETLCEGEWVRFIWYRPEVVTNQLYDKSKAVAVFMRLNVGKIPLEDAELIKALMLNRTYANEADDPYLRVRQQEIALQWDMIESALQDDEFWFFLNKAKSDSPTRIGFLFRVLYEQQVFGEVAHWQHYSKSYQCFRYIDDFVRKHGRWEAILRVWEEVMGLFRLFCDWFHDVERFHGVGALLSQFGGYKLCGSGGDSCLLRLSKEREPLYPGEDEPLWKPFEMNREDFLFAVRSKLWEKAMGHLGMKGDDLARLGQAQDAEEAAQLRESLRGELKAALTAAKYELKGKPKKTQARLLLLLHNVHSIVMQNRNEVNHYQSGTFYKFPFHLFNQMTWDVEHIDSGTTNSLDKENDQKAWLLNVYALLKDDRPAHRTDWETREDDEPAAVPAGELKELLAQLTPPRAGADECYTLQRWADELKDQTDCLPLRLRYDVMLGELRKDGQNEDTRARVFLYVRREIIRMQLDSFMTFLAAPTDKLNPDEKVQRANEQNTRFEELERFFRSRWTSMSEEDKNALWNFALLDQSTNRSYKNSVFPLKRKILLARERGARIPEYAWKNGDLTQTPGEASSKEDLSTFVPPCTMAAFLKKHSGLNPNPNQWTRDDAAAYLEDIYNELADFANI